MAEFLDVKVGADTIRITAYNPGTPATLAKCRFIVEQLRGMAFSEEIFRSWLAMQAGGRELLAAMRADRLPRATELSVDPLNARAELDAMLTLVEECGRKEA